MTRLSVNINKVATIRNARGGLLPDVVKFAVDCENFGAQGITVHPRPDERHIRQKDVYDIRPLIKTEFNIEGFPTHKFMEMVLSVKPHQVTLVPDAPNVLTSNKGWNIEKNISFLTDTVARLQENGIRSSIFVDADLHQIELAKQTKTNRIELFTEPYAAKYIKNREKAIEPFIKAAELANTLNIELNAGHDLSLDNIEFFNTKIPGLKEVSIGHALISEALYFGIENTIQMYLRKLSK